jgi:aminopeptidase N
MLDGELAPARLFDLQLTSLPRETDELIVEELLGEARTIYWRFMSAGERTMAAPRVERVLRDGLDAAKTQSLKGAYFSALRSVSLTRPGVAFLRSVWEEKTKIPGLVLAESDFIGLTHDLALRSAKREGGPGSARAIVTRQIGRTKDPDRKAQLTFVMPALSADEHERDAFFASLSDVANRRHEPWVLDGLRSLRHPLRGSSSDKYVAPSLAMLREIQRTGDIFFPKRWMDATLGGPSSPAVAEQVRAFVRDLPADYPDRLRRIVLSSADLLFRSARTK